MKPKRKRLAFVMVGFLLFGGAVALALTALEDNVIFFFTPSQLASKSVKPGQTVRLGGFVEKGSLGKEADGLSHRFRITDNERTITVVYKGVLPDLFRECQGVIAVGVLKNAKTFTATQILAKHDENYMPKELADTLKKKGVWHKSSGTSKPRRGGC